MLKNIKKKYIEFQNVTVAGTQQYFFPDINDLRNAFIYGMETWSANDIALTQSGASVVAQADAIKAYITLYFEGGEFIVTPLSTLVTLRDTVTTTTNHPFMPFPFVLNGQKIEWTKSYIRLANTTGLTTGRVFHFGIWYNDPAK